MVQLAVDVDFRDQMPHDLERLGWTGGDAHLRALDAAMQRAWSGQVVLLVGELPNGELVASGALDLAKEPPELWMLAVHEQWQSLGLGTALVHALEDRAADLGHDTVALTVEHDNPRARALYERLGYRAAGPSLVESWPLDDGARHVTVTQRLVRHGLAS